MKTYWILRSDRNYRWFANAAIYDCGCKEVVYFWESGRKSIVNSPGLGQKVIFDKNTRKMFRRVSKSEFIANML